jgi:two-component system, NarL family, response regulator
MKPQSSIRILIADDHHLMRLGLVSLLEFEEDLLICCLAEDGQQAVEAYKKHVPDVVLMDLRLPLMDGAEATQAIRAEFPEAKILVLSTFDTDQDIRRAIQAGASGYLVKNASPDALVGAIRSIHKGETVYSENISARIAEIQGDIDLSSRQMEVLEWLTKGLTNKEIGHLMGITEDGVKAHLKHIYHRLHAADRTEAVAVAIQRGYIRGE